MLDTNTLKPIFAAKLAATGSLDEAFLKCVWLAYKAGIRDATVDTAHSGQIIEPFIESVKNE